MGGSTSRPQSPIYGPVLGPSMLVPQTPTVSSFNSLNIVSKILVVLVGTGLIALSVYIIYRVVVANTSSKDDKTAPSTPAITSASSVDQAPMAVDGKSATIIPAANVPLNSGSDYGIQFWMYIKDWNYRFGEAKSVVMRTDPTNPMTINPNISLHPTENSLDINVSIFGNSSTSSGASNPAPANGAGATGDNFTVTVENVPLQSWFAVSVTCFQRNIDVYINGKLVRSAVLPGVARPAVGDITIGAKGGFSGSVCTLKTAGNMLGPADAAAFYAAGTPCSSFVQGSGGGTDSASSLNIFGYKINFGITDSSGKSVAGFST
jgi:hypothetical protein